MSAVSLIAGEWVTMLVLIASLNLVVGKVGVWSVGHVGFFGVGQVVVGVLVTRLHATIGVAVTLALVAGLLVAAIVGAATIRLRSDFFVVASIAFSTFIHGLVVGLLGPRGASGIPRLFGLGHDGQSSLVLLVTTLGPLAAAVIVGTAAFSRSPMERAAAAIRHNVTIADSLGIPSTAIRLFVFVAGSSAAVLAGALNASYVGGTDPANVTVARSLLIFAMMVQGGIDSLRGSILGSLIAVIIPRALESSLQTPVAAFHAAQLSQLIFGLAMLLTIRMLPRGIVGKRDWRE